MRIKISDNAKSELLKALAVGEIDTDKFEEMGTDLTPLFSPKPDKSELILKDIEVWKQKKS